MSKKVSPPPYESETVFCDVCLAPVTRSRAVWAKKTEVELAYLCGADCYQAWRSRPATEQVHEQPQLDHGRSRTRDEQFKRLVKQHPQRDEPLVEGVERAKRP